MMRYALLLAATLISDSCLAGSWGPGSFDNDDAMDFVQQCVESQGSGPVAAALQVANRPGNIESCDGAVAVAAAEVVAAAKGKPSRLPKELHDWLDRQPKREIANLAPSARKALLRATDSDISELSQLWQGSEHKAWQRLIRELDKRLR